VDAVRPAEPVALGASICQLVVPEEDGADQVLLARDDSFADALAGAPLAGDDSCILFTAGGPDRTLDPAARAEIDRVLPLAPAGTVRILGGVDAVSQQVEDELAAAGYVVERLAGPSRFETAVEVARRVLPLSAEDPPTRRCSRSATSTRTR